MDWGVTVSANQTCYTPQTATCSVHILQTDNLTIRIWQEVQKVVKANSTEWAVIENNYNRQLTDPYINDFAYIIAKSNGLNASGNYSYCNVPVGTAQNIVKAINIGNWMGQKIGCNDYWFRGVYQNGEATISVPMPGTYSIYLVEGVINWENNVSPPDITKSNMFIYLGEVKLDTPQSQTTDFWISHQELDFWGSLSDSLFWFMIGVMPILLFIALSFLGIPMQLVGIIVVLWEITWIVNAIF